MNYLPCMIYGGIIGFVGFCALTVLMMAWAKHFAPQPVHTSRTEWPILLLFPVFGGLFGIVLGWQLAPLSGQSRAWLFADWIIYGGIIGFVGCFVLAILMLAWAKHFTPHSVHTSWAEWPVLLFLSVPGGMVGMWLGCQLAPLSGKDRIYELEDGFICVLIMLVSQYLLRKFWAEPDAQRHLPNLLWRSIPFIPMYIYYWWLRHLIR